MRAWIESKRHKTKLSGGLVQRLMHHYTYTKSTVSVVWYVKHRL